MGTQLSPGTECLDLERSIEQQIARSTMGRLRRLSVEVTPERVVVHGFTSSYYVKQLALHGVQEVLRSAEPRPVELDIEVGHIASTHGRG